jgi:toxin CcdB
MPQFRVHRNPNPATAERFPLLLDVQSDLVAGLTTRVVVPLCLAAALTQGPLQRLIPTFEVAGTRYAMLTSQLAGIAVQQLGPEVADLAAHRGEILAALDLLFIGF